MYSKSWERKICDADGSDMLVEFMQVLFDCIYILEDEIRIKWLGVKVVKLRR